jgi:hypothetical protein
MNTTHTPGHWRAEKAPNGYTYIKARDGSIIASVYGTNALARGTLEGNAALLATAPKLASVLAHLIASAEGGPLGELGRQRLKDARVALAEAIGGGA